MQHLMKCLIEGKYLYSHRVLAGTETLNISYGPIRTRLSCIAHFPPCLSWTQPIQRQINTDFGYLNLLGRLLPERLMP
ncbi:hypothetical protein QL285_083408 [Trifolium repens]|nr:hypothetical protein QL285_083408 [Trifolium repens]